MDLSLSSLGALVLAAPFCVFHETRNKTYGLNQMKWLLIVLWFDVSKTVKHRQDRQGPID